MIASLRALLSNVIDYAGLFPPAKLPMEESLQNYAAYRAGPDAWLLGRFLCPAARLAEIPEQLLPPGAPLVISAIGRVAPADGFLESIQADLRDIAACRQRFAGRAEVDSFEVKVPSPISVEKLEDAVRRLKAASLAIFLEPSFDEPLSGDLQFISDACAAGIKLRCGGLEAAAFPSVTQVASFVTERAQWPCPFKATAGLHHPFSHYDPELKVQALGFLTLASAVVLARASRMACGDVQALLAEQDLSNHDFLPCSFGYRGRWVASLADIRTFRMSSFGSCSFEEPVDFLRSLPIWSTCDAPVTRVSSS